MRSAHMSHQHKQNGYYTAGVTWCDFVVYHGSAGPAYDKTWTEVGH